MRPRNSVPAATRLIAFAEPNSHPRSSYLTRAVAAATKSLFTHRSAKGPAAAAWCFGRERRAAVGADEDRLAELESIAQQLAGRVREEAPEDNQRWLHNITTPDEREALLYILAAAVPDDRPWLELTAWALHQERTLKGCGTLAAARRHRTKHERLCLPCRVAEAKHKADQRRAA